MCHRFDHLFFPLRALTYSQVSSSVPCRWHSSAVVLSVCEVRSDPERGKCYGREDLKAESGYRALSLSVFTAGKKRLGLTSKATVFFFFSTDYFQSVHSSSSKDNFEVKNCQFSMSSGLLSGKHNSR